jgi:hypothetical protein
VTVAGPNTTSRFSATNHHASRPEMAPALLRTATPTPKPITAAREVNSRAHSAVAASAAASPNARPPAAAPATPAAIPVAPSTRPTAMAVAVLHAAMTPRAGWAVRAVARVPCCASAVKSRTPATAANSAVNTVG